MVSKCVYVDSASRYVVRLSNGDRVQFRNPAQALAFTRKAWMAGVYAGLLYNGMANPTRSKGRGGLVNGGLTARAR